MSDLKYEDPLENWRHNDYASEYIIGRREGTFPGTPEEDERYGTTDRDLEEWWAHEETVKEANIPRIP